MQIVTASVTDTPARTVIGITGGTAVSSHRDRKRAGRTT